MGDRLDGFQSYISVARENSLRVFVAEFSLIVATVRRIAPLIKLLESLDCQTYRHFELVVVDQNPPGFLDQALDRFKSRFPMQHVRCSPGLSHARNVGIRHARGQILAFPDDDCWYSPEGLENVSRLMKEHEEWDGLTTRLVDPENPHSFLWYDRESGPIDRRNLWRRSTSATMFLRRRVIDTIGDFDIGLGRGTVMMGAEDCDYVARALGHGFALHYHSEIPVFHPEEPKRSDRRLAIIYTESYAFSYVLRRHRYSLTFFLYMLMRALGGMLRSAINFDRPLCTYYWRCLLGRVSGWAKYPQICESSIWSGRPLEGAREISGRHS